MNSREISNMRKTTTEAIIGYYRGLVENTNMTIEEIRKFEAGQEFFSEQILKVSRVIGKPQSAFLGFALCGYVNETGMCYTVVCLIDDAENAKYLPKKVSNIVTAIEESHARRN